jgi:hypothetical protein
MSAALLQNERTNTGWLCTMCLCTCSGSCLLPHRSALQENNNCGAQQLLDCTTICVDELAVLQAGLPPPHRLAHNTRFVVRRGSSTRCAN